MDINPLSNHVSRPVSPHSAPLTLLAVPSLDLNANATDDERRSPASVLRLPPRSSPGSASMKGDDVVHHAGHADSNHADEDFTWEKPQSHDEQQSPSGGAHQPARLPKRCRNNALKLLDSRAAAVTLSLSTIYVLYFNDIRLLSFTKSADLAFEILSAVCLVIFVVELIFRLSVETEYVMVPRDVASPGSNPLSRLWNTYGCGRMRVRGYGSSFLLFLDLLAIASLFPEIDWIWASSVVGQASVAGNFETARGSRIARVGSRLGRILRMARVSRALRAFFTVSTQEARGCSRLLCSRKHDRVDPLGAIRESHMSFRLSAAITRTVILLVLLLIVLIPVLSFAPDDTGPAHAAFQLHQFNTWRGAGWEASMRSIHAEYGWWTTDDECLSSDVGTRKLVKLLVMPATGVPANLLLDLPEIYDNLRTSLSGYELQAFELRGPAMWDPSVEVSTVMWLNVRPSVRINSQLSIALTCFVVILLLLGALQFAADAQALVLRPIEHMIAFVERTALDPVGASEISSKDNTGTYETKVLENTIKKIVGILRVGFGSAGMLTVARHLEGRKNLPSSAKAVDAASEVTGIPRVSVDAAEAPLGALGADPSGQPLAEGSESLFQPFRPGRSVRAVFLRIEIPHFDAICEVLGENSAVYVNKVAKIIHDTVLSWGGAPVANTGSGFLCVWVIDDAWEDLAGYEPSNPYHGLLNEVAESEGQSPERAPDQLRRRRTDRRASLGAAITGINVDAFRADDSASASPRRRSVNALGRGNTDSRRQSLPVQDESHIGHQVASDEVRQTLLDSATEIADKSVVSCLKTIVAVRRSIDILDSAEQVMLRQSKRLEGHRLWLEFGLHAGCAIEGAIGTSHKVDAAYLSADADLATSVQRLTATYGCQILISGSLHRLLSSSMRRYCRKVDAVFLYQPHDAPGHLPAALSLFTLDTFDWTATVAASSVRSDVFRSVSAKAMNVPADKIPTIARKASRRGMGAGMHQEESPLLTGTVTRGLPSFSVLARLQQTDADLFNKSRVGLPERQRNISILGEADIIDHPIVYKKLKPTLMQEDVELVALQALLPPFFIRKQSEAIDAYISGAWDAARVAFEQLPALLAERSTTIESPDVLAGLDEPSKVVYAYMQSFGFQSPAWWQGRKPIGTDAHTSS